jgi:hypothetical protein
MKKNHYDKKSILKIEKTHRDGYGNKMVIFQKKHHFTM